MLPSLFGNPFHTCASLNGRALMGSRYKAASLIEWDSYFASSRKNRTACSRAVRHDGSAYVGEQPDVSIGSVFRRYIARLKLMARVGTSDCTTAINVPTAVLLTDSLEVSIFQDECG